MKRNYGRGRDPKDSGNEKYFNRQTKNLKDIYSPKVVIEAEDNKVGNIAKEIARHALLGDYTPIDLGNILERYK